MEQLLLRANSHCVLPKKHNACGKGRRGISHGVSDAKEKKAKQTVIVKKVKLSYNFFY